MDRRSKTTDKITREQVEKAWRGEWKCSYTTKVDHFAVLKCSQCGYKAFAISLTVSEGNFCPYCGAQTGDKAEDRKSLDEEEKMPEKGVQEE